MGNESELEAAYRLMNNPHVSADALYEAHAAETADRASEAGRVLVVHDTTSCQFSHADPNVIGYLNTGKPGFLVHYSLVVSAQELKPLGVVNVEPVIRQRPPRKRTAGSKRQSTSGAVTRKKPNREFARWERGIHQAEQWLHGTETVHVADRESDSFELMNQALASRNSFVFRVRSPHRAVVVEGGTHAVKDIAEGQTSVLTREVELSSRRAKPVPKSPHPARISRTATLHCSATAIALRRPNYLSAKEFPSSIPVNLVRVWEPEPPEGQAPVEWLLYTTEPIDTAEAVANVVDIYRARWLIEECNKALKTGCLYEKRQFESRPALLTMLALSLPVACEILALRTAARATPNRPATEVMSRVQLEILRVVGSRPLPNEPSVHDAMMCVAGIGGHKKSNGAPGWLILKRGMRKLLDYEVGWRAARAQGPNL